ncbi:MAG: WecB/TagA/CpsF family glycosyltransferase [Thermodesulfobacteriota bacterium]
MERRSIMLFGCRIDVLTMDETIQHVDEIVRARQPRQHVVVNVAKLVAMSRDPELRAVVNGCHMVNADGMPVVWASRLLGRPLPERVAGVDLFQRLVEHCAASGLRPYFLGAREEVVAETVRRFRVRHPALQVAGFRNGYFSPEEEPEVAAAIRASGADLLFVAFPSPKKEMFLNRWMATMEVPFSMGVGGSFDIVAGKTKRAPVWMQATGLEWCYRLCQEPTRMWSRYASTNPVFLWMVLRTLITGREPSLGAS